MNNLAYNDMSSNNYFQSGSQFSTVSRSDLKAIKASALQCLARREYSRLELLRKLSQKFSATDAIQTVLEQLQHEGYQSDDRFTEMFIRAKVRAGNGPFKIKIELREKGICESTVLSVFDRQAIDWLELAKNVKDKRFGQINHFEPTELDTEHMEAGQVESELIENTVQKPSLQELAKQVRYLKNKGFYQEHIDQVINL